MLPSADEVIAPLPFLARRFGLPDATATTMRTIAVDLDEARALATDPRDEPAAIFHALARRARGLGPWWGLLPRYLAQASTPADSSFPSDRSDMVRMRTRVAMQTATFEDVRRYFLDTK